MWTLRPRGSGSTWMLLNKARGDASSAGEARTHAGRVCSFVPEPTAHAKMRARRSSSARAGSRPPTRASRASSRRGTPRLPRHRLSRRSSQRRGPRRRRCSGRGRPIPSLTSRPASSGSHCCLPNGTSSSGMAGAMTRASLALREGRQSVPGTHGAPRRRAMHENEKLAFVISN